MIQIENDCVGCPQGCIHCGREQVAHFYCDRCDCEDKLYWWGDEMLCLDCIENELEVVEGSE